jgi:hypothetical protein
MAGNARFHDKHHRKNHHSTPTVGYTDSGTDPIASHAEPFQGDFVINGTLSSSLGIDVLSANFYGDVFCENVYVRDTTYTNFISGDGTETIISDGALTGFGNGTMTMDFQNGIYAKSPLFIATNSISAVSYVYANDVKVENLLSASSGYIQNDFTVNGNILVNGNLSALGDVSVIETNFITTSSLSVINHGIDTALTVNQLGNHPIAAFENDGTTVVFISSNGVTVYGDISANYIRSNNILELQSNSGFWNNSYNSLTSTSGNWDSTYNTVSSISSQWNNAYNSLTSTSANWNSVYNTVGSLSSKWTNSYNSLTSTSGNWDSTYNIVSSNSANWNSSYNSLTATSANWDSVYNSVLNTSANWNSSYNSLTATSANWDSTYNTVCSVSVNWDSSFNVLTSTSANWESVYSSVLNTSANWDSTYNLVSINSANWDSSYNSLTSTSANWNSTYNTVCASSASWLSGNSSLNFSASTLNVVDSLSTHKLYVFHTIHVSVSSVSLSAPQTITMTVNSPSYWFINVTGAGTVDFNLPAGSSDYVGMLYYFKNVSTAGNRIVHINNSAGTPIALGSTLNGNANAHVQVVWDGTTWQTIFTA